MYDLPASIRPQLYGIFEVEEIKSALYNPADNNIKIINVNGHRIGVCKSECEIVQDR